MPPNRRTEDQDISIWGLGFRVQGYFSKLDRKTCLVFPHTSANAAHASDAMAVRRNQGSLHVGLLKGTPKPDIALTWQNRMRFAVCDFRA